ncbi:hypothetical protein LUZ60_000264 [Juncus effusus]|nr:hypothetical protein LUZ60_000264 [Juncus effusus]
MFSPRHCMLSWKATSGKASRSRRALADVASATSASRTGSGIFLVGKNFVKAWLPKTNWHTASTLGISIPMGNMVSSKSLVGTGGKLIFSDGTTQSLSVATTTVAELMLDHPNHYVIDSHLVPTNSTKLTPLPADHVLETCKVYLLLPVTHGKLSVDEARRVLALARSSKRLRRSSSALMPSVAEETERRIMNLTIPGVSDHQPDQFLTMSRQLSCKAWKPSLGTIVETGLVKKVPHWLF